MPCTGGTCRRAGRNGRDARRWKPRVRPPRKRQAEPCRAWRASLQRRGLLRVPGRALRAVPRGCLRHALRRLRRQVPRHALPHSPGRRDGPHHEARTAAPPVPRWTREAQSLQARPRMPTPARQPSTRRRLRNARPRPAHPAGGAARPAGPAAGNGRSSSRGARLAQGESGSGEVPRRRSSRTGPIAKVDRLRGAKFLGERISGRRAAGQHATTRPVFGRCPSRPRGRERCHLMQRKNLLKGLDLPTMASPTLTACILNERLKEPTCWSTESTT